MDDGLTASTWLLGNMVLALVLHELAHVLVAWTAGARVGAVGCGTPHDARRITSLGKAPLFVGARPWSGVTVWLLPPQRGWSRRAFACVVAAGPLVNLLCGAWLWTQGHMLAAAIHLLMGVANLGPSWGSPGDGAQLWALWRNSTGVVGPAALLSTEEKRAFAHTFEALGATQLAATLEQSSRPG